MAFPEAEISENALIECVTVPIRQGTVNLISEQAFMNIWRARNQPKYEMM